jgi:hypothetical protein
MVAYASPFKFRAVARTVSRSAHDEFLGVVMRDLRSHGRTGHEQMCSHPSTVDPGTVSIRTYAARRPQDWMSVNVMPQRWGS